MYGINTSYEQQKQLYYQKLWTALSEHLNKVKKVIMSIYTAE